MQDLFIRLCLDHVVSFHVVGNIVMIELPRLERVLSSLPPKRRILGLTAYTIDGYTMDVVPEFNPSFGAGVTVAEALTQIAGWPRDQGLWVEPTLSD